MEWQYPSLWLKECYVRVPKITHYALTYMDRREAILSRLIKFHWLYLGSRSKRRESLIDKNVRLFCFQKETKAASVFLSNFTKRTTGNVAVSRKRHHQHFIDSNQISLQQDDTFFCSTKKRHFFFFQAIFIGPWMLLSVGTHICLNLISRVELLPSSNIFST